MGYQITGRGTSYKIKGLIKGSKGSQRAQRRQNAKGIKWRNGRFLGWLWLLKKLDVTEEWVRELIREKQIRASKIGQWRIKPEDLRKFIKSRSNIK